MTAIFKISLRSYKNITNKTQYDWSSLKDNKELRSKYRTEMDNRFSILEELGNDDPLSNPPNIQDKYTKIINVLEESNRIIPFPC